MKKKVDKTKPARREKPKPIAKVLGIDALTHRYMRAKPGTKGFIPLKS